jgi:hypothetical protein
MSPVWLEDKNFFKNVFLSIDKNQVDNGIQVLQNLQKLVGSPKFIKTVKVSS